MNWLKRIFNWKRAPKATNEMKLIDRDWSMEYKPLLPKEIFTFRGNKTTFDKGDIISVKLVKGSTLYENISDEFFKPSFHLDHTVVTEYDLERFIRLYYNKVKKSWKRSPKHYNIWMSKEYEFKLLKYNYNLDKISNNMKSYVGNLYTLYQQYYGKERK